MANTDLRSDAQVPAITNSQNVGQGGRVHVSKVTVDLSKNGVANADTLQLMDLLTGKKVTEINYNVRTPEGAVLTFNLGDGTTAAKYVAAGDLNSSGRLEAGVTGKDFRTADGVLTLTALGAGSMAVVDFWITQIDFV